MRIKFANGSVWELAEGPELEGHVDIPLSCPYIDEVLDNLASLSMLLESLGNQEAWTYYMKIQKDLEIVRDINSNLRLENEALEVDKDILDEKIKDLEWKLRDVENILIHTEDRLAQFDKEAACIVRRL